MADNFVAILMGSDSDYPLVENTIAVLKGFGFRLAPTCPLTTPSTIAPNYCSTSATVLRGSRPLRLQLVETIAIPARAQS